MPFLDNDGVTRLTTDYLDVFARKEDAILDPSGGLIRTDDGISVDSLIRESDGAISGSITELTAEGHAEQFSTTGKNLAVLYSGSTVSNGVTVAPQADGSVILSGTSTDAFVRLVPPSVQLTAGTTYTASIGSYGGTPITDYGIAGFSTSKTVTPSSDFNGAGVNVLAPSGSVFNNVRLYPQLELGSTATEYEPYTGGAPSPSPDYPQEIQVVRGRNLWDESRNTIGEYVNTIGETPNVNYGHSDYIAVEPNTDYYVLHAVGHSTQITAIVYDSSKAYLESKTIAGRIDSSGVINFGNNAAYVRINYHLESGNEHQLTLGSTPQPYVPYGHVGLEARDPDTDELISCTPIPLPARGWVAGLPDGTADSLRLDGAGKCEWTLADAETTTAVTDGITGTVGTDVLSTTGQITDGATVLYKLATPIIEDCGYVEDWPTDISEGATISIPELDALNVKYFIANDSISQYANQWYERTKAVDIADVEDAVGDLASVTANLVTHDQFYVGYDEVNGKKMISIFKRGDI